MLGRERLVVGTMWMMENVKQEQIDMDLYFNGCNTSGCWLGWMAQCPQLNEEGFGIGYNAKYTEPFVLNGKGLCGHSDHEIWDFFNLDSEQVQYLFGSCQSGRKKDIMKRLYTVLNQPGPKEEKEIEELDQEFYQQHTKEESCTQENH